MTEQECLARMVAPGQPRPSKPYRRGVIQIHVTRACDRACYNCTQGSQYAGRATFLTPGRYEAALGSLGFRPGDGRRPAFGDDSEGRYWGVVGTFGGNPALSPHFAEYCLLLQEYVPFAQRGLWCNAPAGKGRLMATTFDPAVSNLNVHLDRDAYDEFKRDWPACRPVGLERDSRHSPVHVAMRDVLRKPCPECSTLDYLDVDEGGRGLVCSRCDNTRAVYDEGRAWGLIAGCDINQHWSAMVGLFRGELRAWFCEVAGGQAILHQDEPDYPDTGFNLAESMTYRDADTGAVLVLDPRDEPDPVTGRVRHVLPAAPAGGEWRRLEWWQLPMTAFAAQVRKHCHDCGVPLRGYGELACADDRHGAEQTSAAHAGVARPKRKGRAVQVVTDLVQLNVGRISRSTDYIGNAGR